MLSAIYPSLKNRRVVVTGGGSGIGAAMVEAFARQGSAVTFLDIAEGESRELENRLSALSPAPKFVLCDLRDVAQIQRAFATFSDRNEAVAVLVNNAASDDRHKFDDVTAAYWDDRIAVNLRHFFFCTQAAAHGMKWAKKGVVINLGSLCWHLAEFDMALYQIAKGGIEAFTRAMSRELGIYGIRSVCLIPGSTKTPRQDKLWHTPEVEQGFLTRQHLKSRVLPEDVAAVALFLASDDARMCTGHSYLVDGGLL
jgi:NAD(P)-dependent dehydrogenase (short-subunit alcohol dehydrogenase family)